MAATRLRRNWQERLAAQAVEIQAMAGDRHGSEALKNAVLSRHQREHHRLNWLCINRIFLNTSTDRSNHCVMVVLANSSFNFSSSISEVATLLDACCNELQPTVWIAFFVLQLRVKAGRESFTGV